MAKAMSTGEGVFRSSIVAGFAYVALPIPRLVGVEVVEALLPAARQGAIVAATRVKAVVDVTPKAGTAVKPGAGSDKHPAHKPVGPIVAVGGAVIGRIVEVPIGAHGRHSNVDADGNLGRSQGCTAQQRNGQS
jgi:hypothetical protein